VRRVKGKVNRKEEGRSKNNRLVFITTSENPVSNEERKRVGKVNVDANVQCPVGI